VDDIHVWHTTKNENQKTKEKTMTTPALQGEALEEHIRMLMDSVADFPKDSHYRNEVFRRIHYLRNIGQPGYDATGSYGGLFDPRGEDGWLIDSTNPPPDMSRPLLFDNDKSSEIKKMSDLLLKLDKKNQANDE